MADPRTLSVHDRRAEDCALLRDGGLTVLSTRHGQERGLAGTADPFPACTAEAPHA